MKFFKCFAIVLILLSFGEVHATDGTPCGSNQSINITGAVIHSNGSANFNGQVYPSGSYGHFQNAQFEEVDEANKNRAHLRGCFCRLKGKPCLPFCCPVGFVRRENSENCYGYTHEEYVNTSNLADRKVIRARDKFRLVQGVPCINDTGYILSKDVEWELFDNGSLYIRKEQEYFDSEMFCFDPLLMDDARIDHRISICFKLRDRKIEHIKRTHSYEIAGMIVSIIFLIITLVIYANVPRLRILRGKLLMCYMAAVVAYYTCMSINHAEYLMDYSLMCSILGFLCYVSALLALFFLNAVNIDYFMTFYFKDVRLACISQLYRWYEYYSIGGTAIVLLIAYVLDSSEVSPGRHKLEEGYDSCMFQNARLGKLVILLIFEFIIVLVNIGLLLATLCKMRSIKKSRSMSKEDRIEYNYQLERETCCHLTLMFLAMDFSWLLDLIFLFVLERSEEPGVYKIFDFMMHSQGIFIFVFCIVNGVCNY